MMVKMFDNWSGEYYERCSLFGKLTVLTNEIVGFSPEKRPPCLFNSDALK